MTDTIVVEQVIGAVLLVACAIGACFVPWRDEAPDAGERWRVIYAARVREELAAHAARRVR